MFIINGRRFNPEAGLVLEDGTQIPPATFYRASTEEREAWGVTEVPDPVRPDERFYFVTENPDGTFDAVPKPASQVAALRKAELADFAWKKTTGGCVINGITIKTDTESLGLITGARLRAQNDPGASIDFKSAAGWITLSAAQMIAISDAVGVFVQACFSARRAHDEALEDLEASQHIPGLIAYDFTTGWPS